MEEKAIELAQRGEARAPGTEDSEAQDCLKAANRKHDDAVSGTTSQQANEILKLKLRNQMLRSLHCLCVARK